MEIICIDKRTFDELVVRFSMIEKKVTVYAIRPKMQD